MTRGCEICGSADRTTLYRQRFAAFDDRSAFDGYDVVSCGKCGFVYADGIPEQDAFDRYYREMSKYESHDDEDISEATQANHRAIAFEIAERLPNRAARILDLGSASGHLLAMFRELGYEQLLGVDPAPACSEIARQRYGVEVINAPISALAFEQRQFDLVLLSNVLEHLRDLVPTVRELAGLVAPGGALWFEVPDASRFASFVEVPFQQFSLEHINFFTSASLAALLMRVDFAQADSWAPVRRLGAIEDPVVDALFRPASERAIAEPDRSGRRSVCEYVERCVALEQRLQSRIARLIEARAPITVWGTGTLTLHLLASGFFGALPISAFVDSNRNYQGKTIQGIPVVAPEAMRDRKDTILIVSRLFEAEIAELIRSRYRLANPMHGLFGALP